MTRHLTAPLGVAAVLLFGACTSNGGETDAQPTASHQHDHGTHAPSDGDAAADVPAGVARQYAMVNQAIAENGGERTSGEWRVAYVIGPAKSWHVQQGEHYTRREPAPGETNHIEIIPFEASSGRLVPDVPIRLELLGADGKVIQAQNLNFYWSDFAHYANNFAVPASGRYTLRATRGLGTPTFLRHDHSGQDGAPMLAKGTTVEFTDVEIDPGS